MANYIIIRLHPDKAITGASFANYLDGLTVTAFDLSCGAPKTGIAVGTAAYIAPPDPAQPWIPDPSTGIVQHFTVPVLPFPPTAEAVATAVIPVSEPAGYREYVTPDLRIELTRSGAPVSGRNFYYDVAVATLGSAPTPGSFPSLAPAGLYLTLPAPVAPGLASVELSDDGTPPNFLALKTAITTVLSADQQPVPPAVLGKITPDQARHIAYEIIWGAQDPLPDPPPPPPPTGLGAFDAIGALYTDPPNDGTTGNSLEQNRQQFEGELNSFYATRNAKVDRLARFVCALSAAVACEELSANAKTALLQFPVNPGAPGIPPTITGAGVVLVDGTGGSGPLVPPFTVPAEYFYVLGVQLPTEMAADQRFLMACRDTQERLLPLFSAAFANGTIDPNPAVNPAQAVRRLTALAPEPQTSTPRCRLDTAVLPLANDWLDFPLNADWPDYRPGDDPVRFWTPEATAQPAAYLSLVLCALTEAHQPLIDAIRALPVASVPALAAMTEAQWKSLFGTPPDVTLLPPFTLRGTPQARVAAFIRHVQKFFQLSFTVSGVPGAVTDPPPSLDLPTRDFFALFVAAYEALIGAPFTFGAGPLSENEVDGAVAAVFPSDPAVQGWLKQRIYLLNDLCLLAGVVSSTTVPPLLSTAFSIAEALYARGFTSAGDINLLSLADFAEALRGTVAFAQAATIYARAAAIGPPPPPQPGPFHPVNPGSLVDCIPPCHLSPLGTVQYLHELLNLSEAATCDNPFAGPVPDRPRVGEVMAARRGALGDLAVTAANAETELPLIDIVNENLEYLAATLAPDPHGVVYNTAPEQLAEHQLCPEEEQGDCCVEGCGCDAPGDGRGSRSGRGAGVCDDRETASCCSHEPGGSGQKRSCHRPADIFPALPEHSAPAVPVAATAAYDRLKSDFSAPLLPYCEPLDVCRSYLERLGSCRFEAMRTFRREITEFPLDPSLPAPVFQSHLWRLPAKIEIAIEYLQFTPEEYRLLFLSEITESPAQGHLVLYEMYGFDVPNPGGGDWVAIVLSLPEFLKRTGLSYCELLALQREGCFAFEFFEASVRGAVAMPQCQPCCLERYSIRFTDPADQKEALRKLAIFLRLWRKLHCVCGARYGFAELCDICEVLQLFIGPAVNPDFIRQLVAFQLLRDRFGLRLSDGSTQPGSHGAERCHILALWVGTAATHWQWAVEELLLGIRRFATKRHQCREREPLFIKLLGVNLDPLSVLAGFDPSRPGDSWQARPANTLRFAEVLAKVYASSFGIGELLYLFTADEHVDGDDPFPLQDPNESLDRPLQLPEDDRCHALWALRRRLLEVEVDEENCRDWNWSRIEQLIRDDFGYQAAGSTDYLLSLGRHFFPTILEEAGIPVAAAERQYRVDLAAPSPELWNDPPDGPFRYDSAAGKLWTRVPLRDEAVIGKLERLRELNPAERQAVQDLYFLPRADLAPFACFFPSFAAAERHLIEERDEEKRWGWFRRHFILAYRRCRVIAEALAAHVAEATASPWQGGEQTAWLILKNLCADENRALTSWEDDAGSRPDLTWKPLPAGGAFAALLGLTGTGLLGEYRRGNGLPAWREQRGPLSAFATERNEHNAPEPTLIPALDLTLSHEQLRYVELRNGFGVQDQHGRMLGGAEAFEVEWSGVLLVEEEGSYRFFAGAPTPEGEEPDFERAEGRRWRVTLSRGQKSWIVLCHRWPGAESGSEATLQLKSGAYRIVAEFVQPAPDFTGVDDIFPQHTGFQLKYAGPDTGCNPESLPLSRLYREFKDDTLGAGIASSQGSAAALVLQLEYTSTLRDIRRTYQRAFKALLFAHRFELCGRNLPHYRQSELGYLLDHGELFAGASYYRNPVSFSRHAANFDFNLLPLKDRYHAPAPAQDQRVEPTAKRVQALFDWWERIFDYTAMRRARREASERPVWLLFQEALAKQPDNPAQLLRHLDVDLRHAGLVLSYFQGEAVPVYPVSSGDLEDDRWAVRAWHADRWVRRLLQGFYPRDIEKARPDLWASDDPGAAVAGESEPGNANLTAFFRDGCIENGEPRRYHDIRLLNDRLRERARCALLSYLCGMNRVPLPWGGFVKTAKELSELLLIDVEAGLCQRATRIEEAVTALQLFIRRAGLGLEPGWQVTSEFLRLWKHQFESFRVWERCKCRSLYKENWIEWDELRKARETEAFRFLESELRRCALTIAVPGGLEWWPETLPPVHPALKLLQEREPSTLRLLTPAREGLGILGTPERDARPSWLAPDFTGRGRSGADTPDAPGAAPAIVVRDRNRLPYWIEAAIRLGVKFVRVAAGGVPAASADFRASDFRRDSGCCLECGCSHPQRVDEYYFWLIAARLYNPLDQEEYYDPELQDATPWHDEQKLPGLLDWKSAPGCRLAWCRVHNGELKEPRRSVEVLELSPGTVPDLLFLGRVADSLAFSVSGGIAPVGYQGTDAPGFRYDLAADYAVALPLVADLPAAVSPYPAGLPVYPYFAFEEPGASLFPDSPFSPAVSVAALLRCHCRFEPALKWYRLVLDPLLNDNSWVDCAGNDLQRIVVPPPPGGSCCDSTAISAGTARKRAVLLLYLETLVEWSHALMRRNGEESAQQARLVLDAAAKILGPCPPTLENHQPPKEQTVSSFVPLFAPLNPRLMDVYLRVSDGLARLRRCQSESGLSSAHRECREPYWGQQPCDCGPMEVSCGCEVRDEPCGCDQGEWCHPQGPYRYVVLVEKAREAAAKVRELGAALLAAYDRGDAEFLGAMRARHETQLCDMTMKVRQDQWREADWQLKALRKSKEVSQTNRRYFKQLIDLGLNNGELNFQSETLVSVGLQTSAIHEEETGAALRLIPDLFLGFPCEETWLALGSKLGGMFEALARINDEQAGITGTNASLELKQSEWQRRLDEWVHQVEVLDLEIEQIELQILASERHRDQALEELNIEQRQLEQYREAHDFLRDKFTSHELYLYLQKETAAIHGRMYQLARLLALKAQRALNFELGYSRRDYLPCDDWDNLHEGLLAGERLELALQRMETEYYDRNRREYELTKHVSLALHFPLQFLKLKLTGCCEIEIPEWMFDLDYPGHYLRRIRNVSLTIPCVTGPYTGVHCRLTLIGSRTRIDPGLPCPVTDCCAERPVATCGCRHEAREHYEPCRGDRRVTRQYGAREAIATSSGRNDAGLFELNFRDERHLPFEFCGAVSCWRIELPAENNFFDMDSLTDVIMHMNYTAREGGAALRSAAHEGARWRVPGNGWILIDLKKDFPDVWELFRRSRQNRDADSSLTLRMSRKLFPFLPKDPPLTVTEVGIFLDFKEGCEPGCTGTGECPCPQQTVAGSKLVELTVDHRDEDRDECGNEVEIFCVSSSAAPRLYHGIAAVGIGPIDRCHDCHTMTLTFEDDVCGLERLFLLCRYEIIGECGHRGIEDAKERGGARHE
jgi:hypothetical protein